MRITANPLSCNGKSREVVVVALADLWVILLTIAVFGLLALITKGVEKL